MQVDVAIMEVGMGGAYDCTNIHRYFSPSLPPSLPDRAPAGAAVDSILFDGCHVASILLNPVL